MRIYHHMIWVYKMYGRIADFTAICMGIERDPSIHADRQTYAVRINQPYWDDDP